MPADRVGADPDVLHHLPARREVQELSNPLNADLIFMNQVTETCKPPDIARGIVPLAVSPRRPYEALRLIQTERLAADSKMLGDHPDGIHWQINLGIQPVAGEPPLDNRQFPLHRPSFIKNLNCAGNYNFKYANHQCQGTSISPYPTPRQRTGRGIDGRPSTYDTTLNLSISSPLKDRVP